MLESAITMDNTITEPIGHTWTDEIVYLACPEDT